MAHLFERLVAALGKIIDLIPATHLCRGMRYLQRYRHQRFAHPDADIMDQRRQQFDLVRALCVIVTEAVRRSLPPL